MLDAPSRQTLGRMGSLSVRLAADAGDVERALALRALVFGRAEDADRFDPACDHLVVETTGGEVVATYRLLPQSGSGRPSYVATEFAVEALYEQHRDRRFLELGRSCVRADHRSKRVMELLWHGTWAYVVRHGFDVMLGCASLPGTQPDRGLLAFLRDHAARAPEGWRVRASGEGVPMQGTPVAARDMPVGARDTPVGARDTPAPAREALRRLPPLIKGYLRLGAMDRRGSGDRPGLRHDGRAGACSTASASRTRYLDHFGADATRFAR